MLKDTPANIVHVVLITNTGFGILQQADLTTNGNSSHNISAPAISLGEFSHAMAKVLGVFAERAPPPRGGVHYILRETLHNITPRLSFIVNTAL